MANKLKNIFSTDEPQIKTTLRFENKEALEDFKKKINQAWETGEAQEINNVVEINNYIESYIGKQAFLNLKGVSGFIDNVHNIIPFPLVTDYGEAEINLLITRSIDKIEVKAPISPAINIKIIMPLSMDNNETSNFSFSVFPDKASCTIELIRDYNTARHFLNSFIRMEDVSDASDIMKIRNTLLSSEKLLKRIHAIEEKVEVNFKPQVINVEDASFFERLYVSLIKEFPIRKYVMGIETAIKKSANPNGLEVGQCFETIHINQATYYIWGTEIEVYEVIYIHDAVISYINYDEHLEAYIIKCVSSDTDPLYYSYLSFLDRQSAEDFIENRVESQKEDLIKAKTLNEIIKSLVKEDTAF